MNKRVKKLLSVAFVLVLTVAMVSGCGKKATPESLLTDMSKNLAAVKSAAYTMEMDIAMSDDSSNEMSLNLTLDMETVMESMISHAEGSLSMGILGTNTSMDLEMYQEQDGKDVISYTKIQNEWSRYTEEGAATEMLDADRYEGLVEDAEAFTLAEDKVEVNGKDCFELSGVLKGEQLESLIDTEMLDSMGAGSYVDEDSLEDLEIPCVIDIYEDSILPAKIHIDMKDSMSSTYESQDIIVDSLFIDVTFTEYDSVDEIVIPQEAVDADEISISDDVLEDAEEETSAAPLTVAEQSADLGENWDSYTVQLNDTVVTLPCEPTDLEAAGLKLDTDYTPEDYMVNAGEYEIAYYVDDHGNEIMVDFLNTTDKALTVKECLIGAISVDEYSLEEGGLTVIFPGGIQLGASKEDVMAKYGECEDIYEGDSLHMYTWYDGDAYFNSCEIDFDADTGNVCSMNMTKEE